MRCPTYLRDFALRLNENPIAKNTGWMLLGQWLSLGIQLAYFAVLARLLGSVQYGAYVGAASLCSIAGQYSSNGAGVLFLRYVSTCRGEHSRYLGNILASVFGFGTMITALLYLLGGHLIDSASAGIIVTVALGDCIFKQLTDCFGRVFQAYEQMKASAVLALLTNCLRLIVVCSMLLRLGHSDAASWAWAALAVSAAGSATALFSIIRRFGAPSFSLRTFKQHAAEGLGFSFSASAFSAYNDIDKTMLSHYGMVSANGAYAVAYRTIDVATMPLWAYYNAQLPRLFRAGVGGVQATIPAAKKILLFGAATGIISATILWVVAPAAPRLIGPGFQETTSAMRWLCLLPVIRAFQMSAGGSLTGSGLQRYRTVGQATAVAFNVGMNLYLIPHYSWRGAAWSSLGTDGLIAVSNWAMVLYTGQKERNRREIKPNRRAA
jgi:O-antigen/teichoic acid export membrane protein